MESLAHVLLYLAMGRLPWQGCQGATAELAFNYTMSKGQILDTEYKYTGQTGSCKLDKLPKPTFGIKNFVKLPINEYAPLLAAVAKQPISISVDASKWQMYEGGVFTGCPVAKTETAGCEGGGPLGTGLDPLARQVLSRSRQGTCSGAERRCQS